jgi:signal peptidase II
LVIDQIAKAFARSQLVSGQPVLLVPHILNLTYVHNEGAAFGLFPGRQPVFIATSCFVLFVIAAYWRRAHPREWPLVIALAMVSAGALGNLIDRVVVGQVTDFFEFAFVDFPVFNVADMAIIGGVAILALWILFPSEESPAEESAGGAPDGTEPANDVPIEDEVPW